VLDECWQSDLTTLSLKPTPVQACVQPKVPFDQGIDPASGGNGGIRGNLDSTRRASTRS
jgi:hypothetical protein